MLKKKRSCSIHINPLRILAERSPFLYGQFLEHFHRQIYGGIFDPQSPFADEDGFRSDVLDALREIGVPIIRWPGGCFVSAYHWKTGVGNNRMPYFDKAWRVEEPNWFGTDEFVKYCRKLGAEPYICTNAGTGTPEEMSDWVEYCNLKHEGLFAKQRILNGYQEPHAVKYWSIGNENWGPHEMGSWLSTQWGPMVREAAKMMQHVDPSIELSAAALPDPDWNLNLLKYAGDYLDWISIHGYWDPLWQENHPAGYEKVMLYTSRLETDLLKVEGLLSATGYTDRIRIAYDEWNLRGWHHPGIHTLKQSADRAVYIGAQDKNDDNSTYTMADAVFAACFLNMCHRHARTVGMANFAPAVNARGIIYADKEGIVKRSTYYVFWLYTHYLGEQVVDLWENGNVPLLERTSEDTLNNDLPALDLLATAGVNGTGGRKISIAAVNKDPEHEHAVSLSIDGQEMKAGHLIVHTLNGPDKDSYNDRGREEVRVKDEGPFCFRDGYEISLKPHSVNIIEIVSPERGLNA